MGFGQRFNAATRPQLRARATPSSGSAPEAIWQQFYDTQDFVSATTTELEFFRVTNLDRTLSNMDASGQFPEPQFLTLYDLTCDLQSRPTFATPAADPPLGDFDDHALILKIGRPTWTLTLSDKNYGPYSLTLLHATGGPVGGLSIGGGAAANEQVQWANNAFSPGWNYKGSLIIPPKTNFSITLRWAAVQTVTATIPIRISLHGIISRRVL